MSAHHEPGDITEAHDQTETHTYTVHYPDHAPRDADPHYKAFEAYRRHHIDGAVCYVGERVGFDWCKGGLELHHTALEFATINAADPKALHKDFPEVPEDADKEFIANWAESSPGEFRFLCSEHHRGRGGAHVASHSDWTAQLYVPGYIS